MWLLPVVALAIGLLASCGNEQAEVNVQVTFSKTASSATRRFVLQCDSSRPDPVCDRARARQAVLFPEEGIACPLPASTWILDVRGTWEGRDVRAQYSPCFKGGEEAVDAWMRLFGFEPRG